MSESDDRMRLAELTAALYGRTGLQQEQLLKDFIGRDVEIRSMICDVTDDSINLDVVVGDTAEDKRDWEIVVRFEPTTFGEELLSYSYGEDVAIVGRLSSADVGFLRTLIFDLQSIRKTGSTLDSRDEAQRKAEASKCFVATACFGDANAREVVVLQRFRDTVLITHVAGRALVDIYNRYSPPLAATVAKHVILRRVVRGCITPLARVLHWIYSTA